MRGWRIGQAEGPARLRVAAPLLIVVAAAAFPAREARASDQAVAEAGREGRALLKELQTHQAAGSASTPSDSVKREAARLRTELQRDQRRAGRRPAPSGGNGGVPLTKGICNGCGV